MRLKAPIIAGTAFGLAHCIFVGLPFLASKGGGEALGYRLLYFDLPLYVVAELAFQRLLLSSVLFNFLWFVVLGTGMYILVGYGACRLVQHVLRKKDGPREP